MRAHERHLESVPDHIVFIERLVEVRAAEYERAILCGAVEFTRGIERVHDCDTEAAAGLKNAARLTNSSNEIVDVLKRQVRDHAIERSIGKWKLRRISN